MVDIIFNNIQIVFGFRYPNLFDRNDLVKILNERGFEDIQKPDFIKEMLISKKKIVLNELVTKNDVVVFYDETHNVLGIRGKDFEQSFSIFKELETILQEKLDIDFEASLTLSEAIMEIHAKTDKNAKIIIKKFLKHVDDFDKIFNEKTYLTTLRIMPDKKIISEQSWFDMLIEPLVTNPTKYFIMFSFRKTNINEFNDFMNNINDHIEKVIDTIERGV